MQDKIECRLYTDTGMSDIERIVEIQKRYHRKKIALIVVTTLIALFLSTMLNVAIMKHRLNQEKEKQVTEWTQE